VAASAYGVQGKVQAAISKQHAIYEDDFTTLSSAEIYKSEQVISPQSGFFPLKRIICPVSIMCLAGTDRSEKLEST
jgi:hypothetical protein